MYNTETSLLRKFVENKIFIFILCLCITVIIGIIDYLTGNQVQVTILYILPIFLSTWYIGRINGILSCILSTISMLISSYLIDDATNYYIITWNLMLDLLTFFFISFTLWKLKSNIDMNYLHARIDFLTNIPNMKAFYEKGKIIIEKCKKEKLPLAVAFIDCDNFKKINDEYGHESGDKVLKVIAHIIKTNLRDEDIASRFGGDEFVIMLAGLDEISVKDTISRINTKLAVAMLERKWPISLSIGVSIFLEAPEFIEEPLKIADELMYKVKNEGKNGVIYQIV